MTLSLYAIFRLLMCSPLNSVQIYPFLVHLPERRQLPQLGHFAPDQFRGVIDLFPGREAAEGEPDRAVRELVGAPERAQQVRRLERSGGPRGPRGHRDVLHRHDQRLALDEVEADVEVVRNAPLEVAVDVHLLDVLDAVQQPVAQRAHVPVVSRHLELGEARRLAEADDLVRRQRAGAKAALVAAAVDLRLDAHARLAAHVERADAFRAVDLVRGDREQVGLEFLQVDVDPARALHRVAMEDDAFAAADLGDLPHRVDDADLVIHHHDRSQDGVRTDRRLEFLQADDAVFLDLEVGGLEPLALELADRVQHRLVLGLLRDDVLALGLVEVGRALDGEIVALGRARRPHDLLRVGVEQRSDMAARLLDRRLGLPAESVRAARGIAEILREVRNHLLGDAAIDRSRRRIVKVDRKLHAATFSEGLKSLMTATGLPLWCATRSASVTEDR